MNFKEWLEKQDPKLSENLWGNVPARTRKPSDGWRGKQGASMPTAIPKMMKK